MRHYAAETSAGTDTVHDELPKTDDKKSWEIRATIARERGWSLLLAASKCFEIAEIATAQARRGIHEKR